MKTEQLSKLFPDAQDMHDRYHQLVSNDPFSKKREMFLQNYQRQPWKRNPQDPNCKLKDANFGQFAGKINAAMSVFISVLTERNSWIKVVPRYPKPGENIKPQSDRITSAFHKLFIRPWENRYMMEVMAAFDMVFYSKAIEHWPSPGCVYSENIPVEQVFPDTNATMDTKTWSYVFVVREFTVAELYDMLDGEEEEESINRLKDFDKTYLRHMLEQYESYVKSKSNTSTSIQGEGSYSQSVRDDVIKIVYAYVKDQFKKKKKISLYVFPAELKEWEDHNYSITHSGLSNPTNVKTLLEIKGYTECMSRVVAVRTYHITRKYWQCNSFAEQIFLSTTLYDKSMSLVIRAAKRNMVLMFKSDNPDTQKKLMKQNDSEVQIVDPGVEYLTTGQLTGVRDLVEVVREIMVNTERDSALASAPGSQNVKGYAITAQEATLNAQRTGEAESLNIRMMINQDLSLYKEIYRRAVKVGSSKKFKRSLEIFKKEMEMFNVPEENYDYDEVFFVPNGVSGGSQSTRIANSQMLIQALSRSPTAPGEQQAQRDLVGAIVGVDNVEAYISDRLEVNPVIIKAGSENEDLDNPYANPMNLPVLPTDKHLQELPIHIGDYEKKLTIAQGILKAATTMPNAVKKIILLSAAQDLVAAQDNKGGHINAHIQAAMTSKENQDFLQGFIPQYKKLQSLQDEMAEAAQKMMDQTMNEMSSSDLNSEQLRHAQAMNQLTETHTSTMNDIAVGKDLEKKKSASDTRSIKVEQQQEDAIEKLAATKASNDLKIENQKLSNEIKDQQKIKRGTK